MTDRLHELDMQLQAITLLVKVMLAKSRDHKEIADTTRAIAENLRPALMEKSGNDSRLSQFYEALESLFVSPP